jgi:anti-sigma factor RsiW
MTMPCGEARRLLWPDERPRAVTGDLARAHEHLEGCASCQAFLEDMMILRRQVQGAAPQVAAPIEVRNRLYASIALARTAPPPRVRQPRWLAAAAAVAVLAAAGSWAVLDGRLSDDDPFADLAYGHSLALGGDGIASADPDSVSNWLSARVPFAARVPSFDNATLEGAHLCMSQCRQGIVMEYQVGTGMVSYYVMPADVTEDEITPFDELDTATRSGYRIASWREPGLLHVMVGNVPEPVITDLATSCRRQFQTDHPDRVATVEL